MNKKIFFTSLLLLTSITAGYFLLNQDKKDDIEEARKLHRQFVENSPYKETIKLSRNERKALSLPPNSYNEYLWELTMNPTIGRPTPYKVESIDIQRKSVPGTTRDWEERGPTNVGGRTRVLFYDPNDVGANNGDGVDYNRVFAGGVGGGLWVNNDITNNNSVWNIIPGLAANLNVSAYAIDPNDSMTFYIGTGEHYASGAAIGNGLYKTTDGGATWSQVTIPPAGPGTIGTGQTNLFTAGIFFINDVIVWDNNGTSEIFVGVSSTNYASPNFNISSPVNILGAQNAGLYRSTDDGNSWARIESSVLSYNFNGETFYVAPNDFEISADNTLYMSTINVTGTGQGGGRLYRSTNGATWTFRGIVPGANRVEIAASSQDPNLFYIAAQVGGAADLRISTNALLSNTPLNEPDDADNGISATDFSRGQAGYDLVIEVDPSNDQIIYAAGIDTFRSTNGGTTWSQISRWTTFNGLQTINAPVVHADIHALSFNPSNTNQALIGSDGGVSWAQSLSAAPSNGNAIQTRVNGYNVTQFYYGSIAQTGMANGDDIVGGAQDNGTTAVNNAAIGSNNFTEVLGGDGAHVEIDSEDNYAVITTQFSNHRVVSFPNYGFRYCVSNCSDQGGRGDFINVAELDRNLNYLYSNSRNTNGTNAIDACQLSNNSAVCNLITNALISSNRPTAMTISPFTTSSSTLFIGTEFSGLIRVTNANTTSPTWTSIRGSGFLGSVSDIAFGTTELEIYVTMHNYGVQNIWYTNDGGVTWEAKEGNLPDMPVKAILANPLLANEVIIGTEMGIYTTDDFNSTNPTWVPSINGMTNVRIADLDLRTSDNTILATTHGRGMFTGVFDNVLSSPEFEQDLGIKIHPTVSDGSIFITSNIDLPKTSIQIFNLNGQQVFITESDLSSNEKSLQLDLKSGFYLVSLSSNNHSYTEKIIIK